MKISLRRLAVFRAVIDQGGVNAAADYLGISQPSVTAHVKALERELGGPLFVRRRGRSHLQTTEAGAVLSRYALDALSKSAELEQTLSLAQDADAPRLRIAAQRVLANNIISPILADFLLQNPSLRTALHSETQEIVRSLYASNQVDLAFLFGREDGDGSHAEIIGSERLGFIAAPSHPLARRRSVAPAELSAFAFVGGLPDSEFFALVREAVTRVGVERLRFVLHLQDTIAVQRAVARNVGVACTVLSAVRDFVARGDLVVLPVRGPQPELPVCCLNRVRGESRRALVQSLIARVKTQCAEVAPPR